MRPLRLEMKGFSAFRDETVIDFGDVDLVALVGATGSGKSSVIDAMTFALYGSAARYDEKLVVPVINQVSTEARVRFTFEVGGVRYAATRVVRRTKTGATTKEARLERAGTLVTGEPKQLTAAVTDLLGLDFQQFNKTVVLPQGRFAEFLHDTPAARQELLRELLGYSMYEQLGSRARERGARLKSEAAAWEQAMADLGDISDERLGEAKIRAIAVGAARTQLVVAAAELAEIEDELAELNRSTGDLAKRRELLLTVEVPSGVVELTSALDAATDAERVAAVERDEAVAARRAAADAVSRGPDVAECQRLLADHRRHRELTERVDEAARALASATSSTAAAAEAAGQVRSRIEAASARCVAARQRRDAAERALREAGDPAALRVQLDRIDQRAELDAQVTGARRLLDERAAREAEAAHELEQAKQRADDLARREPGAALAAHLQVGQPCPVCAQRVRELPPRHDETGELEAARERLARVTGAAGTASRDRAEAAAWLASLQDQCHRLDRQIAGQPERGEIEARLLALDELTGRAEQCRAEVRAAEAAAESASTDPSNVAVLHAEQLAAADLAAKQALHAQHAADLAAIQLVLRGGRSEIDVEADLHRAVALADALRAARARDEQANDQLAARQRELAGCAEAERRARHELAAARDSLAVLRPPVQHGSLADEWRALAAWCSTQAHAATTDLAVLQQARPSLTARRDERSAAISSLAAPFVDDPALPVDDLRSELAAVEATAKGAVEQLERARARAAATAARIERTRDEAAVAEMLGRLLQADQFLRWLVDEAMQDLVGRATERLRELTGGHYSLVSQNGAFQVVDHRNADEVRDARSLSGGETFLTSLSLALALADSSIDLAAEGAAPMESIFLDEGFGTLDPDTLDTVAGTIEELGATGRMVGIVTHIRELAERMPTRLEVSKGPAGSTVVRVDA